MQAVSTALHPAFQATTPINSALKNFDLLPSSSHLRLKEVKQLLGVSSATIWRLVSKRELTTTKLTERTTTFQVGMLRAFLASKASTNYD